MHYRVAVVVLALFVPGCGAKSPLIVPDVHIVEDASTDTGFDAVDVPFEAPPEICVDGGVQFIYVITVENRLYSFYPPTLAFSLIGTIRCTLPGDTSTPFSMGVDRGGTAYVVFNDGHLYRVSTATAACEPTPFAVNQLGFMTFGMAYASDIADEGEHLYVAEANFSGPSAGLATIDTTAFTLTPVGTPSSPIFLPELSGTGDGRLFAFSAQMLGSMGSFVSQLDTANGNVVQQWPLPTVTEGNDWAFAFWGDDFYIFTATGGPSTVTRFRPSDGSVVVVATMEDSIVGAGVSTCAPH